MTKAKILFIRISILVSLVVIDHLKGIGQDIQVKGISFFEGLNTNVVSMSQDKNGFIWIATFSKGLFKYDGSAFVNYISDPQDSTTLPGNALECVLADENGNIWVGSQFGLSKLDPITNKFRHYMHDPNDPESLKPYPIIALAKGKDGCIWIGTQKGLSSINTLTGKIKHKHTEDPDEAFLQEEHIRSLYTDKTGTLWIGCGSPFYADRNSVGGLFKLDNEQNITRYIISDDPNSISNNNVKSIFEDSRGVLWIGTAGDGLHTLDRQTNKFTHYSIDPDAPEKLSRPALGNEISYVEDHITFITEDDLGWIWIGTMENGINRYDPESSILQHFGTQEQDPFKIPSNKLFNAFKSADDKLWIMTWDPTKQDQSILKVNTMPNRIPYTDKGSLASSFVEDKNGNIYIGYRDGFFEITDLKGLERRIYLPNLNKTKSAVLNSLMIDGQGTLWITVSEQGLYRYSISTDQFEHYIHNPKDSASISTDFLQKVIEYGDDTLLIASDQGLEIFSRRNKKFFSYLSNILRTGVSEILRSSDNTIWIGFEEGGIFWFKGNDQNYTNDRGGTVFNIFQDSKNQIWSANRYIGLAGYNKKSEEFYAHKFSQPLLVRDVGEDPDRNLWLKTLRGYGRFNPEREELILLESDWGINSNLTGNDIFVSSKGEIFNGYDRGYNHFIYNKILADSNDISQPYISGILIDDEAANLNINLFELDQIDLSHLQKNLALEFGSIDFSSSEEDKLIQYKLIPYENAWKSTTSGQKVSYYNLSPGNYTLKLISANAYGHWTEKEVKIIINPPWYNTWWAYLVYTLLIISLIRIYIRFRGRQLQAENDRLEFQVKERTNALSQSLENLKSTQAQLIQSEKMASLGELTAGIAHEIQNPLNFVNNFSEVNKEMLEEMNEELEKGNLEEVKVIARDIIENEEKIHHHGRRASGIVKGMLEHSRTGDSKKELTDLNALADEYLRLAYHGLRAKDKSFNADFKTEFDENLPKVNVIPQDIGRVLLNLINNAFYACTERSRSARSEYHPLVMVSTKKFESRIEISVKDNGEGIPEEIKDKIFQPFFTTKPTGSGTGLGLSLSYDIVKAHGGLIELKSELNKGSTFIISIPS